MVCFAVAADMVVAAMKRRGNSRHEPQNLKRFRASVQKFTQDQSTTDDGKATIDADQDSHNNSGSSVGQKSRKSRRRDARKLKKLRKDAFSHHVKVKLMIVLRSVNWL